MTDLFQNPRSLVSIKSQRWRQQSHTWWETRFVNGWTHNTTQHCQPANFGHVQKTVGLGTNDVVLAIAVACSIYSVYWTECILYTNCILIEQKVRGGVLSQRIYLVQEQMGWRTRLNIALVFKSHPSAAPTSTYHYVKIWLKWFLKVHHEVTVWLKINIHGSTSTPSLHWQHN